MDGEMTREFESEKGIEILPQNFAELTAEEAGPILQRASGRLEIVHGKRNEFWNGVRETFDGMAGWIEGNAGRLRGQTLKVISGITLASTLMTACATEVSARPIDTQASEPVPATATYIPTEIPTELPTPTEIATLTDLNPNHTETISQEFRGVLINTNLVTDESLDPIITSIKINDGYTNSNGESAREALTEFTARTFYKIWLRKGGVNGTGPETNVTFEDYMQMWAEAQDGTRSWEELQIIISVNNPSTEGYDSIQTTIWPMYSGEAPEGIRAIKSFEIDLVKASKMKNIKITNSDLGVGYGTNIQDGILYIYRGLNTSSPNITSEKFIIESLSTIPAWIITNSNPTSLDRTLTGILSNNNGSLSGYKSVLNVTP